MTIPNKFNSQPNSKTEFKIIKKRKKIIQNIIKFDPSSPP